MKKHTAINSKTYIILADLLKKKRSEYKTRQVEEVLSMNISVPHKIKKIYSIDNQPEKQSPGKNRNLIKHDINFSSLHVDSNVITSQKAEKFRDIIKNRFIHHGYLSFLFHDFLNIIVNFSVSKKPSLLKYRYFPPRVEFNLKNAAIYNTRIRKTASMLSEEFDEITGKGWMLLTKDNYNLLMAFIRFCRLASAVDPVLLLNSGRNIMDNINEMEKLFLTCNYRPSFCRDICNASTVMKKSSGKGKLSEKQIVSLIRKILLQDTFLYTMHDFLTEINILFYNRFLTFQDLTTSETINPVSNYDYEFPASISSDKKAVLKSLEDEMNKIINDLQEINSIDKFMHYNEKGEPDKSVLFRYYDNSGFSTKRSFTRDRIHTPVFIKNCLEVFLNNFEDFLCGRIELRTSRIAVIFHENIFKANIDILNFCFNRLNRISDRREIAAVARAGHHSGPRETETVSDSDISKIINSAIDEFDKISRKMITVVSSAQSPEEGGHVSDPVTETQIFEKKVFIPFSDLKIRHKYDINDNTVMECIQDILEFTLLAACEISSSKLSMLLSNKFSLKRDLFLKKDNLKRLANPIEYRNIKERINFPALFFN